MKTLTADLAAAIHTNGRLADIDPEMLAGDIALAELFVRDHCLEARYVPGWRTWTFWDSKRWKRDETGEALRRAVASTRGLYAAAGYQETAKDRAALAKHAQKADQRRRLEAMLALASVDTKVVVHLDQLDADPWALNAANGVIDLKTGALRPHRREELHTKIIPVAYDPAATCPVWDAFLLRILNRDAELIAFLRRACGYSLTGSTREQVFFVAHGAGSNGKTSLLTTLRGLLADYAIGVDIETLLASKRHGGAASPDVVRLRGARFVTATETEIGRRLAESLVKRLTGGDAIVGRDLYQPGAQEFTASLKLWVGCNHRPAIRGTDHAMWRRVRLIPFTVTIADQDQDRDLPAKLEAERPGILAWCVRGCLEWQRDGLGTAAAVRRATAAYRDEQDPLGAFLRDRCHVDPKTSASAEALYTAYEAWCEETGDHAISGTAFGRALAERGFEGTRTKHGRFRIGLRLLGPGEQPAGDGLGLVTGCDGLFRESPYARAGREFIELPDTTRHPSPEAVPQWVRE